MCNLYKFFNRLGFILAIIAALAMPIFVLCATASAAETQMYLYNGVELPALPEWDKSKYPYANISGSQSSSWLLLSETPFYGGSGYGIVYENRNIGFWIPRGEAGTSSDLDAIFWANYDVLSDDGTLYLAASDPVPVGGSSLEFEVSASWEDTTYQYNVGETADVFSVSTGLGTEYDISYQWFGKAYEVSEFTALTGETFSTFVPQTDAEHVGAFTYYCSVTVTEGTQSVTVDSPFLYVTVYEAPEYTDPTVDETDKKLDVIQDSLGDIQNSIDDILTGTEEQKGQVDSFGDITDEQFADLEEDVSLIDQVTMPNIDDIDLNIDTQVSGDGMTALAMLLGLFMNSQVISTSMTFAFLFALVAFVIFGKR